MNQLELTGQEKAFAGTIKKIKLLESIKPQGNWVFFSRTNLAMQMKLEHKKVLLNQDLAILPSLFSWFRQNQQPKRLFRLVYSAAIAILVVVLSGGITVWATMKSLPGSPLYPVKIAIENLRLAVVSGQDKDKFQSEMTDRRIAELKTVLSSSDTIKEKNDKVQQVVDNLQQQLNVDKANLPKAANLSQNKDNKKLVLTANAVSNRAEQVKKAVDEAKNSLSNEIKPDLSAKLTEVTDSADRTSLQALETIINKTDLAASDSYKGAILEKFETIIKDRESAVGNLIADKPVIDQASSTSDKLPINAVLVNQADQAKDIIVGIKEDLAKNDYYNAIEMLKALDEILKSAQTIAANASLQDSQVFGEQSSNTDQNTTTSLPQISPEKDH